MKAPVARRMMFSNAINPLFKNDGTLDYIERTKINSDTLAGTYNPIRGTHKHINEYIYIYL